MTQHTQLQEVVELSTQESDLSPEMVESLMQQVSDWHIIKNTNGYQLQRTFNFDTFHDASHFVNEVAQRTQTSNHYPHVIIDRQQVLFTWWTPEASGLAKQDFVMAIATDETYDALSQVMYKQSTVDEASAESFPASDPPAYTPTE